MPGGPAPGGGGGGASHPGGGGGGGGRPAMVTRRCVVGLDDEQSNTRGSSASDGDLKDHGLGSYGVP